MTEHPIVVLAALMGLVTYGTRIVPFLLPLTHLPDGLIRSMRPMGPATLAAVASVAVAFPSMDPGTGPAALASVWLGTGVCVTLVAIRRSLATGIVGALATGALVAAGLTA